MSDEDDRDDEIQHGARSGGGSPKASPGSGSSRGGSTWRFAGWKKALAGAALLMVVVGAGLQATSLFSDGSKSSSSQDATSTDRSSSSGASTSLTGGNNFLPSDAGSTGKPSAGGGDGSGGDADDGGGSTLGDWSPALMKLGFSFFVGLAIGYAVRSFLKISLLLAGVILLAIFGLSYFGMVQIDWTAMEGVWDSFVARVQEEAGQFRTFIAGSLPSAGMAGLGLVAGFKRR